MLINSVFLGKLTMQCGNLMNFSVIQILREINFGTSRSSKSLVFFAISGALNFVYLADFILQRMQKFMKTKIQSLYMC